MTINKAALDLITEFEGLRLMAYQDSVGVWTIGYGTTAAAGVGITPRPGMTITEAEAETYLRRAIDKFAAEIRPHFQRQANENQFGAMVSLAYDIGSGAFIRSTLLRRFNEGDTAGAFAQFLVWNKAGGQVLNGLVRRRAAERALFDTPAATAPSAPVIANPFLQILNAILSLFRRR